MRRTHGFTLVELLIVIAIIVILAAILFPVFSNAKRKSQEASCLSNIRQLTAAIKMYAGDNDDRFPLPIYADLARSGWGDVVFQGYVNNDQIYDCPSGEFRMYRETGINLPQSRFVRAYEGYPGKGYSYGLNFMQANLTLNPPITKGGPAGRSQGEVEDASGTILLCDGAFNTWYQSPYVVFTGQLDLGDYRMEHLKWEVDVLRHGAPGKFNAGFCDGHAKLQDLSLTIDPQRNVNMWTVPRYN